ncbi:MAG: hypothetical protein ABGZ17_05545 [Planctomycetaceae bacterium]
MNCMRAALNCVFWCLVLTVGLWAVGCAEQDQGSGAPEAGSVEGDSTTKLPSEG